MAYIRSFFDRIDLVWAGCVANSSCAPDLLSPPISFSHPSFLRATSALRFSSAWTSSTHSSVCSPRVPLLQTMRAQATEYAIRPASSSPWATALLAGAAPCAILCRCHAVDEKLRAPALAAFLHIFGAPLPTSRKGEGGEGGSVEDLLESSVGRKCT